MMAPMSASPAIEVHDLRKNYGEMEAVAGIDFHVERGEIYGLLGPNGAGKTSTVEILEGYRARSSGTVCVLGHDPQARPMELTARWHRAAEQRHLQPGEGRRGCRPLGRLLSPPP